MKYRILNIVVTFTVLMLVYNCGAQNKVDTINKLPRTGKIKLLKSKLNLTDIQINKIIDNDSIMDQVVLSLKDSIVSKSVKVKLDSFYAGKYDTKKTWLFLKLQLRYKNASFESASKKESVHFPKFKTVEEFEKYYDKIDSLLSKPVEMVRVDSIKNDSTKKKKQKQ
ncbi:hypothetical protein H2O64_11290 [Kordia sp. YSTF-M3]|uniref:DUF4296 domain-containing protein n=1 Tax=Kordia aestuariivivens TaxID=2759037 RepID=A0ABR7Q9L9_9FLAO|nr:hypothetical protein [Kordia aestuariivivens]MBC8755261.1 hypothetical protein [Kordia aestuariivivens]